VSVIFRFPRLRPRHEAQRRIQAILILWETAQGHDADDD
jgi:hypothetical protein